MIYFDNAATSLPKPPGVGQAVLEALSSFGGAGRGSHPAALNASRCIYQARLAVAELLGGDVDRTVFTQNATESLNIAIGGLFTPKDHVITTVLEHNSVLRPLYRLREQGMGLSVVGLGPDGGLDYDGFARSLRGNTKAVVCTHASNLTGYLLDIGWISAFCKAHGLLLIVDAAQTAGVIPIHQQGMGIDVLCFTGHKGLMGPQGTGGLCIRDKLSIPPLKVGGSGMHSYSETQPAQLPDSLEAGTLNGHGIAGLLCGIRYIGEVGIDVIYRHEMDLAAHFLDGISQIPGVQVYRRAGHRYVPIVALNIRDLDSGEVAARLADEYGICVRPGAHCAPLAHIAGGTKAQGAVRFSFSSFNTAEEIQTAIQAILEISQ